MPAVETSRGRLLAVCFGLFVVSIFLTSYSARNPWMSNLGAVLLGEVAHPIQRGARHLAQLTENIWTGYIYLAGVAQENDNLRQKISVLDSENSRLGEVEKEVERLRSLMQGAVEAQLKGIVADIIGYDPSNWTQAVTVSRGAADGVKQGMAVVQGNYLVGKVIGVGRSTSQVLLLLDPTSGVDALVQNTRVRGLVEGNGRNGAIFQFVPAQELVKVGDRLITSGMDGVFPKGLVIGVVSEIERGSGRLFQKISVKPSVKFRTLETVLLVSGRQEYDENTQKQ